MANDPTELLLAAGRAAARERVQREIAEVLVAPDAVLRRHLITSDYRGKVVKAAVLDELLARARAGGTT